MGHEELVEERVWRFLQGDGLERCELRRRDDGWVLCGALVMHEGGRSADVRYRVACDARWRTREVEVHLRDAAGERVRALRVEDGRWLEGEREWEAVRGCVDVDLQWSPCTNTLPVRRLGLAVGQGSGPVVAAWVRFPVLTLERLPQEYRRLEAHRYRYESNGGAFTAELTLDAHGLVVDYGGVWQHVGDAGAPSPA